MDFFLGYFYAEVCLDEVQYVPLGDAALMEAFGFSAAFCASHLIPKYRRITDWLDA